MTDAAQTLPTEARAPSFKTAFLGFVSSLALMTTAMVVLGGLSA